MEKPGRETSMEAAVSTAPGRDPLPAWDQRVWLVAIPLALIVLCAFFPILHNGFAGGDDDTHFVDNPYFRGLGAAQINWAWTTTFEGAYQPLSWLLYETQYVFCQLDPRGYHLTSLFLHVANAVVLYVLTVVLLVRCRADCRLESPWACCLSAGLAAALFAVHPLRVEAVAGANHQPFLCCALFSMLAILAYLRAFWTNSSPRWGWLVGSFCLFVTALLFRPAVVGLPIVLLILDIYPLRRLRDGTGRWFGAPARTILLEKVPFVIASLFFMGIAIAIRGQSGFLVKPYDPSEGIAQACYAIWFYIEKTVLPLALITFYPLPRELNWLAFPYSLSIFATLAISAGLILLRRRWPELLAAWLSYLVLLAPVSGIIQNNNFVIAADRYSYMSMLVSVILSAAGFRWFWRTSSRRHPAAAIGIIAIGLGALLGLTALTRIQCRTWLNVETVWAHALAHGAKSSFLAHNNLGNVLLNEGKNEEAGTHFTEALRLNPGYDKAHYNLGNVLYLQGKYEEAEAHFNEALRLNPGYAKAHYNLGVVLDTLEKYQEAEAHFTYAVRLNPGYVEARYHLGIDFDRMGKHEAAMIQFAEAIKLVPNFAEAFNAIAMIMAACPDATLRDGTRAVQFATRACKLTQWKNPHMIGTLAAAQAEAGEFNVAVLSQEKGLELLTDERERAAYRSRLALYRARRPYREHSAQHALRGARP